MKKFKIIIAGIGGVGGYFGGKLANSLQGSEEVEIIFYARGKNLDAIRSNGLTVQTAEGKFTANPALSTDNAAEIGLADLIICCVKSYHLETVIRELNPCIGNSTVILPLLNGTDAPERLRKIRPGAEIWAGCAYIVARLTDPGMIEQKGNVNSLHFGSDNGDKEKLRQVQNIFLSAGIDSHLHPHITEIVWQKFVFISAIGSLTSYLHTSIDVILANDGYKKLLLSLLSEISTIAKAKRIRLPEDLTDTILKRLASLPAGTTSSMQKDFADGKQTELDTLAGYVIRLGEELKVPTPTYELVVKKLSSQNNKPA